MPALAARWVSPQPHSIFEAQAQRLAASAELPLAIARVLLSRGFDTSERLSSYLSPTLNNLLDPNLLKGMPEAIARIEKAIARKEKILLYGDYDVDGTSALVILKTLLDLLGGCAEAFVPHRLNDGYGMKGDRIRQAAADGVALIVSVDTGIRAGDVVRLATELGVDTIVTDHHLPESEIPPAAAVLNPNQPGCVYPNKNLCGAGVAFKLAQGLLARSSFPLARQQRLTESLLKMAALATVADIVPLEGENRAIVKLGLEGMTEVRNPGLRALLDIAGIRPGTAPTARQVGFQIGPRINAAGRMASAAEVLELFLTSDVTRARQIAATLDDLNKERQQTDEEMREAIFRAIESDDVWESRLGLVLFGAEWHLGVAGIVAGRVAERHRKPTFVLAQQEKDGEILIKGSGRSIHGFHLLEALESMGELFEQHGGHAQAAGLTMRLDKLPEFQERFAAYAAQRLDDESRRPVIKIDEVLNIPDVDAALYAQVQRMAPFGYHNQPPVFALLNLEVAAPPLVMKGKHLKITVRQAGRMLNLKAWNVGEEWLTLRAGARIDAAFQLEHDSYDGWAPIVKDLRRA